MNFNTTIVGIIKCPDLQCDGYYPCRTLFIYYIYILTCIESHNNYKRVPSIIDDIAYMKKRNKLDVRSDS